MNFLIDTNILIQLEDDTIVGESFSSFYRLAVSNNCKVMYHPQAVPLDLQNDQNERRRKIILSKLEKYVPLENPSEPDSDFLSKIEERNSHDKLDNIQLYQSYKGYVDYFITEDKDIHKKAQKLSIASKILHIQHACTMLKELFTFDIPQHPSVREGSVRNLQEYINSDFFDSLRSDYGEEIFNNWFDKCVRENRHCYWIMSDRTLQALLIYHIEKPEDHKIPQIYEKVLKICTLKVADTITGSKLGELFLQKMFEYCVNNRIGYVYITTYPKQKSLIFLLKKFGFEQLKTGKPEEMYIKCMKRNEVTRKNIQSVHPFYVDDESVGKFAIPIRPQYYSSLFKDGALRDPQLFDLSDAMFKEEIQGNTITKAYICSAYRSDLKPGDILLFYASKVRKVIEPIGILESIQRVSSIEELLSLVQRRTVYDDKYLKDLLQRKGTLTVIRFRLISYMPLPINLEEIKQIESFRNRIQTITKLSESDYLQLKANEHFDERYIIN